MKVIVAAGGTFGHINPAKVIADEIKRLNNEVYFITDKKRDIRLENIDIIKYDSREFNRKKLFNNIINIFKNFIVYKKILRFIKKNKVDLVIGFGASISTLALKAGIKLKGVKTILHEQNAVMGLGNRLAYKKVNKVLLTYDILRSGTVVGNPINYDKLDITNFYNKTILITSGTNGAEKINHFFMENYNVFISKGYKLILITGDSYYKNNIKRIIDVKSNVFEIYSKLDSLKDIYKKCSMVVCRSGSTTLSEVLSLKKLIITIPSPNVTNNHQEKNAIYYENKKMLEVINERELQDPYQFLFVIENMYKDRYKYVNNIEKYFIKNSKELFINEVYKVINNG